MYTVYVSNKNESGSYDETLIFTDQFASEHTALIDPTLEIESGTAGQLDFTYPPSNVGYSITNPMTTEVIVKKNDTEVWRGRVLDPETDFYNQMKVTSEGELTYLTDTYQPQHEYKTETLYQFIEAILSIHNQKVATWDDTLQRYVPNASEPFDKTFYVGAVFVSEDTTIESLNQMKRNTDYETTLESLKKIADAYKGYFIIRKVTENGYTKRYLDFIKDFDKISEQTIHFGQNLLDYDKSFKMEDLCTVALPIGAKTGEVGDEIYIYRTEDGRPGDDHEFNYLDDNGILQYNPDITDGRAGVVYFNEAGLTAGDTVYYTGRNYAGGMMWAVCDGNNTVYNSSSASTTNITDKDNDAIKIPVGADRLRVAYRGGGQPFRVNAQKADSQLDDYFTIKPHPDYEDDYISHKQGDPYIINKHLYAKYGWHEKKLSYSNLDTAEKLFEMSANYLKTTQFEQMTLEITALDMSALNAKYDDIWINMKVPIYSKPHGLTDYSFSLPCTKMRIKLNSIENTEYTLGYSTYKGISNASSDVKNELSQEMSQLPNYSDTVLAAQRNATAIMDSLANTGVVTFVRDPNDQTRITQIMVLNNSNPEVADGRWVWNYGGFGFQKKVNGQWQDVEIAMTKDGAIVADKITSHSLTADKLSGGELTLGATTYTDPITGQTTPTNGSMKLLSAAGNRVGAFEEGWGLTVETNNAADDTDGYFMRMRNGFMYGGFKHPVGQHNVKNGISDSDTGEECTGRIRFNNGYITEGTVKYGVDIRGGIIGLVSDGIWLRRNADISQGSDANPTYVGLDFAEVPLGNGKALLFCHGICVGYYDVS